MQPVGRNKTSPQQLQIRKDPRRRLRQYRQGRDLLRRQPVPKRADRRHVMVVRSNKLQYDALPRTQPHGEQSASTLFRAEQQLSLRSPPVRRPRAASHVSRRKTAPRRQFAVPTGVPEMPMQIEPETPTGMLRGPGRLPERQRHPLPGTRPGRRGPHHQLHATTQIAAQGDRQPRPEPSVRSDPWHVPAEQIRRQPPQIRTKASDEFSAMPVAHSTQIEINVDPSGGTSPRPVAGHTSCGGGLDHRQRYGVLAHALPHQQAGRNRGRGRCHQHSPCANDSPDPYEELLFIPESISAARAICQSTSVTDGWTAGGERGRAGRPWCGRWRRAWRRCCGCAC